MGSNSSATVRGGAFQRREERWAIVNLVGKGRHIRTVPVPNWVKETLDAWLAGSRYRKWSAIPMCLSGG